MQTATLTPSMPAFMANASGIERLTHDPKHEQGVEMPEINLT